METIAERLVKLLQTDSEALHYTQDDLAAVLGTDYTGGLAALALKKLMFQEIVDGGEGLLTALVPDEEILSFIGALGRDEDYDKVLDELENQPPGYFPPHDSLSVFRPKR